jgi:hypothetical protein
MGLVMNIQLDAPRIAPRYISVAFTNRKLALPVNFFPHFFLQTKKCFQSPTARGDP